MCEILPRQSKLVSKIIVKYKKNVRKCKNERKFYENFRIKKLLP